MFSGLATHGPDVLLTLGQLLQACEHTSMLASASSTTGAKFTQQLWKFSIANESSSCKSQDGKSQDGKQAARTQDGKTGKRQ
jgi:hypothetical protein